MLKIEVSYRGLLLAGLALVSLWALIRLWPVIVLIATAFIFMAALLPYVDWLVRRRLPRTVAVLTVVLVILGVLIGLTALVVPAMVSEFKDIRENLPQNARDMQDFLSNFGVDVELEERARNVDWGELISGRTAVNYGQQIAFTTFSIFTVIVLTAYLLIDTPRLSRFLFQFVPPGREPEVETVLESLGRVVGGYIRGQVITSAIITVYTLVVLLALGVPNAVAFAVLAGFSDIMPIIGPFIAILPATAAAFQISIQRALIVAGLLVLYQQFEDRFLVPRVYGQTLNLPPLVVLIAVLAGGELYGVVGVLLALPAAAVGRVIFEYWLDRWKAAGTLTAPLPTDEPMAPDEPKEGGHGA